MERTSMALTGERLHLALRECSRVGSIVASYCDRTEHNEQSSADDLRVAARRLRDLAVFLSDEFALDILDAYAARLERIEATSPMESLLPSPPSDVRRARTARDLQVAQLRHDRHFHPDVFGLPKREQLVHITLHLSKLAGALAQLFEADEGAWLDFAYRRLPDFLLFGIKISTVSGETLGSDPLTGLRTGRE